MDNGELRCRRVLTGVVFVLATTAAWGQATFQLQIIDIIIIYNTRRGDLALYSWKVSIAYKRSSPQKFPQLCSCSSRFGWINGLSNEWRPAPEVGNESTTHFRLNVPKN